MQIRVTERVPMVTIDASNPSSKPEDGWSYGLGLFADDDWLLGTVSVAEEYLPKGVEVGDVFGLKKAEEKGEQ